MVVFKQLHLNIYYLVVKYDAKDRTSLRKHRVKLIMSSVNKDKCHCLNVFGLAVYSIDFK